MRRRDWAGTVLVACLVGAAGLLRNHTLLLFLLLAVAAVSAGVILSDRRITPKKANGPIRVSTASQETRVPLRTASSLKIDEGEAKRIAASRDPRFAQYREMPKAKAAPSIQDLRREAARRAVRGTPQERELRNLRQQVQALLEDDDQRPVPEAHREELKELAAAYSKTIDYHRAAVGKQGGRHEHSFWAHFPDAGRALETCDRTLEQRESARAKCASGCNGRTQSGATCSSGTSRRRAILRGEWMPGASSWMAVGGLLKSATRPMSRRSSDPTQTS